MQTPTTPWLSRPTASGIASASEDRTARVWEAETGREIARIEHVNPVESVAFAPDGLWLATASGSVASIHALRPEDHLGHRRRVLSSGEWNRYILVRHQHARWSGTAPSGVSGAPLASGPPTRGPSIVSGAVRNLLSAWFVLTGPPP